MKKIMVAIMIAAIMISAVACTKSGNPNMLYVGSFMVSDNTVSVEFDDYVKEALVLPDVTKTIYANYYGYEGPWEYYNSSNISLNRTGLKHFYYNSNNEAFLILDYNGNCICLGELNIGLAEGKEVHEGDISLTQNEAIQKATDFAKNTLNLSVEGYEISCLPFYSIKGEIDYYRIIFDKSFKGDYTIKDYFEIFVDGYYDRCPLGIREFDIRSYKKVDREEVPKIDVEKFDALINSKIFGEARKETKEITSKLKLDISEREIIKSPDGKLYYRCYAEVSKESYDVKDGEKLWNPIYYTGCFIPLN